jgi:hypothetical protein
MPRQLLKMLRRKMLIRGGLRRYYERRKRRPHFREVVVYCEAPKGAVAHQLQYQSCMHRVARLFGYNVALQGMAD